MGDLRKEDDMSWLQILQEKEQRRAKRRRQVLIQKILLGVFVIAAILAVVLFTVGVRDKKEKQGRQDVAGAVPNTSTEPSTVVTNEEKNLNQSQQTASQDETDQQTSVSDKEAGQDKTDQQTSVSVKENSSSIYQYQENTRTLGKGILSSHAVLVDTDHKTILACKDETERIVPASMTKVLTLLTAVEQLEPADLDEKFKITVEITDYCYVNECSVAGFQIGEKVTVRDLLYGTILPSGADAAIGLAEYVSGSQEAFVKLMNAKLEELGLSKTAHFTNCVGIYDEKHYCTIWIWQPLWKLRLKMNYAETYCLPALIQLQKIKNIPKGFCYQTGFYAESKIKIPEGKFWAPRQVT